MKTAKCSLLAAALFCVATYGHGQTLFWVSQENFVPNGNPDLVDTNGVPIPVGSMWATMMFVDDEADGSMVPDFSTVAPQFSTQFPGDDAPEPISQINGVASFAPGDFFDVTFNDYPNQLPSLINEEVFTVLFNDPDPMNATAWTIVPDLFTGNTITFIDVGIGSPQFDYVLGEITAGDWNLLTPPPAPVTTNLSVAADAFLDESATGNNTGGSTLMAAGTDGAGGGRDRRGLMRFDLSGIPFGSTINAATITVDVVRSPNFGAVNSSFGLHLLLTDWGEGAGSGDHGQPASPGDATWNDAMQGVTAWIVPGGQAHFDYVGSASASQAVSGNGPYQWSSPGLVLDLQFMVDNPGNNFGWILISQSEGTPRTARGFGTAEGGSPAQLSVNYTPPTPSLAAAFTSDVQTVTEGDPVQFQDLSTSSGTITNWAWTFGDGAMSTNPSPSHTYMTAGTYTVALAVFDDNGNSGVVTQMNYITVLDPPPVISCPADVTLASTSPTSPYGVPAGPVVHYDFNHGAFAVQDISGSANVHNGSQAGVVSFGAGVEGQAADLIADGCVGIADHPELNGAPVNDRAISLWFIIDSALPPNRLVLYEEGGANAGINLYVNQASQELNVGVWKGQGAGAGFTGISGVDYSLVRSGIGTIVEGQWYHVSVLLDSTAGTVEAWLNDVSFGSDTFGFPLPTHTENICVGGVDDGTRYLDSGAVVAGSGDYLNGRIDQFLLYNRVLTSGELSSLSDTNLIASSPGAATAVDSNDSNVVVTYSDQTTGGTNPVFRAWMAMDSAGNSAICTQTITVLAPLSVVVKTALTPGPLNAGDEALFEIQVENVGTNTLDPVHLLDEFDTVAFNFVTSSIPESMLDEPGGMLTWSNLETFASGGSFDPGDMIVFTTRYVVAGNPAQPLPGVVTNRAGLLDAGSTLPGQSTVQIAPIPPFDLDVDALLGPDPLLETANQVEVNFVNRGANSLNGLNVSVQYSTDNGATWPVTQVFTPTTLGNTLDTEIFTFSTPFNLGAGQTNVDVCVRVNPQVAGDPDPSDLLCVSIPLPSFAVLESSPANGMVDVPSNQFVQITFDNPVQTQTVDAASLLVHGQKAGPLSGVITFPTVTTAVFQAASPFLVGERVDVTLAETILGVGGVALENGYHLQFDVAAGGCTNFQFRDSGQDLGSGVSSDAALVDVDGDGDLDSVIVVFGSASQLWLNDGSGGFTNSGQALANGDFIKVTSGDVNGDGPLDFVFSSDSGSIQTWTNNGSGQFSFLGTVGTSAFNTDLGDVDGDGDLDLCVADARSRIYFNDGAGGFTVSVDLPDPFPFYGARDVELGDLDGDGDLDVFAVGQVGENIATFVNDGAGSVSRDMDTNLMNRFAVSLGDLDGDNDLDAVTVGSTTLDVWINDGSGGFSITPMLVLHDGQDVDLGDLDGDGDLDAFVANAAFGLPNRVYLNDGSGVLSDSGQSLGNVNSTGVQLGDVDGDGRLDALVSNQSSVNRLRLNSCGDTTVEIVSGDLVVTDIVPGGKDDTLIVALDGSDLVVTDTNNLLTSVTAVVVDVHEIRTALSNVTGEIRFDLMEGDDEVVVDFSGGDWGVDVFVDAGMGADEVVIVGTPGDDMFAVSDTVVTGTLSSVTVTNNETVVVVGADGDDRYSAEDGWGVVELVELSGGGSDTVDLSSVSVPLTVVANSLTITDAVGNAIVHANQEIESVLTGSGGDDVFVLSLSNSLSVATGDSSDTFEIGESNSLDGVTGPLTLDGGDGFDFLNVNDQDDADADAYAMTGNSLQRGMASPLAHTNIEFLTVNTTNDSLSGQVGDGPGGELISAKVNLGGAVDISGDLLVESDGRINVDAGVMLSGAGVITNRGVITADGDVTFPQSVFLEGGGTIFAPSGSVFTVQGDFGHSSGNPTFDLLHGGIILPAGNAHDLSANSVDQGASLTGYTAVNRPIGGLQVDDQVDVFGTVYVWELSGSGDITVQDGAVLYYVSNDNWMGTATTVGSGRFEQVFVGFDAITQDAMTNVVLGWPSAPGLIWQVETTDELVSGVWVNATGFVGAATSESWTDDGASGETSRYYRLQVRP